MHSWMGRASPSSLLPATEVRAGRAPKKHGSGSVRRKERRPLLRGRSRPSAGRAIPIAMSVAETVSRVFPGALPEKTFVRRTLTRTKRLGFTADNTIACVGTCRDELCRPLEQAVFRTWGEAFNFSSLGGFPFLGRTGVTAARSHAPLCDGKERYAFFALPHIGLSQDGELGVCHRSGQTAATAACGALDVIRGELERGPLREEPDREDPEMSLIRRALAPVVPPGSKPDLLALTRLALGVIERDLERLITLCVGSIRADYAVFSGIQINTPDGNWVLPQNAYAVVDWAHVELDLGDRK